MIPATWAAEVDAFARRFAKRATRWDKQQGDLEEDIAASPWTDPDQPNDRLDAAYRSGIISPAARVAGPPWDALTILRAHGRRLTKHVHPSGTIDDFDSPKHFDMTAMPVDGIDHLEETLRSLLARTDRCIVRGQIAEIGRSKGVRRLLHDDGEDCATLIDVRRWWLALDVDSLPRPDDVAVADLPACSAAAIARLPIEFQGARHLVQATAGHGLKPGIRLRLWFWLDRPTGGAELRFWLRKAPVDPALFGAAQIIYTAAPIFIGQADPIDDRLVRVPGQPAVRMPTSEMLRPPVRRGEPIKPTSGLSPRAAAALDRACRRIARAPAGSQERILNGECFSIGSLASGQAIPTDFALRVLLYAARQMVDHDPRRPWRDREIEIKVTRAFNDGLRHPREARHAR